VTCAVIVFPLHGLYSLVANSFATRVIIAMNIKLINRIPTEDGYFLMKFKDGGGPHLVLIQTQLDGTRVMIPENYNLKKQIIIKINQAHGVVFGEAWFSETPIKFECN
jgi:hypothetical protein